jgi:hypothetical protein
VPLSPKPPRELHGLEVIRGEMQAVDAKLPHPVDVYLLGGCAMSYLRLKTSTKDLDLVMQEKKTLAILEQSLRDCKYKALNLEKPYDQLRANALYKRDGAPQWDLYVGQVCGCLSLSPGIQKRATLVEPALVRLRIHACSPSDIFVFKSITEREADLDDLDLLASQGLVNWAVVLDEMDWQRQNSDTVWTVRFLERLEALEARGFTVPITKQVRALAEADMERTYGHKLPK